jgi:hypothetical protein
MGQTNNPHERDEYALMGSYSGYSIMDGYFNIRNYKSYQKRAYRRSRASGRGFRAAQIRNISKMRNKAVSKRIKTPNITSLSSMSWFFILILVPSIWQPTRLKRKSPLVYGRT